MDMECGKDAIHISESRKGIDEFSEDLITGQPSDKINEAIQIYCVFDPTCTLCKFSDFWLIDITKSVAAVASVSDSEHLQMGVNSRPRGFPYMNPFLIVINNVINLE
jgi:hypothetical protein